MKRTLAFLAVLGLLFSCSSASGVTNLNAEQFLAKSQEINVVVVDVRTAFEFAQGSIPSALNIPVDEI